MMEENMDGVLIGVGVGPGDPGSLTLKAIDAIKHADVLYIPHKDADKCRAFATVKEAVPEASEKEIVGCDFEMTPDPEERKERRNRIYLTVKEKLEADKTVAFVTIGDPSIYSTFSYIADLAARDGKTVRVVSGISSPAECAASLGISLCEGQQSLHVIPGPEGLPDALKLSGTKVVMKCPKDLTIVKESIRDHIRVSGHDLSVYAVTECGMPGEKQYRSLEEIPDKAGYLTTVIIKENKQNE
ncbi:MAG: precorrin-2 C(20)-methyltransferase [Lachnospiraceae bacterium]|nr:precorrin-2 C(20)-methyltransferase [Lachnospiraceae bacterium]